MPLLTAVLDYWRVGSLAEAPYPPSQAHAAYGTVEGPAVAGAEMVWIRLIFQNVSLTAGTNIMSRPQISALLLSADSIAVTKKISSVQR